MTLLLDRYSFTFVGGLMQCFSTDSGKELMYPRKSKTDLGRRDGGLWEFLVHRNMRYHI